MAENMIQGEGDVMPCEMTDAIQGLWEDLGVRQAYARRNELQINDSAS
jgi:guanine nucleotide-binding protein subunit alpha